MHIAIDLIIKDIFILIFFKGRYLKNDKYTINLLIKQNIINKKRNNNNLLIKLNTNIFYQNN